MEAARFELTEPVREIVGESALEGVLTVAGDGAVRLLHVYYSRSCVFVRVGRPDGIAREDNSALPCRDGLYRVLRLSTVQTPCPW